MKLLVWLVKALMNVGAAISGAALLTYCGPSVPCACNREHIRNVQGQLLGLAIQMLTR